jgi:hypothetical protein
MENNSMRIRIFFIVALLLTSVAAWAQNYNIPNLTVDEVKKQLDQPGKVLLVDTRTEEEQFTSIGKYLPKDKSLPIIFYCRGYS